VKAKIVDVAWEEVRNVVPRVVMVPTPAVRFPMVPALAKSCVVEAVPAKRLVEVTPPNEAFVANKFVDVVFVPVAFVHVRPEAVRFPLNVRLAKEAFVAFKFVAKRFVDVAFVLVAFVNTPVDGVVAPIVVPLRDPPLMVMFEEINVGAVRTAMLPESALMDVPEAVVNPNHEVEVPFPNVRFVMEPFVMTPFDVNEFVDVVPAKTAVVAKRFVDVVFVPVAFVQVRFVGLSVPTERLVIFPLVAKKFVVVTLLPVTFVNVAFPPFNVVLFNIPIVPFVAFTLVALIAPTARRLPVALRNERSCKDVCPRAINVPVAVRLNVWMPPRA
jgi:hypothetical protein